MIGRRQVIALLGGAAVAWPVRATAQQPKMPVIGFLTVREFGHDDTSVRILRAFHRGLAEHGLIEGDNVTIVYRASGSQYDRLPALAAELAQRPVTILVTSGGVQTALAARTASSSIPHVFMVGSDPVKFGLVASYAHPGGNATGINILTDTLESKRLGLLRDLVPAARVMGLMVNPNFLPAEAQRKALSAAASSVGLQVHELLASDDNEIVAAFEVIERHRIPVLLVAAEPFFNTRRDKIVALAARHAVPTMYQFREYTLAGGLVSYGIDVIDAYRQLGAYAGRVLKGTKPADLPVVQPTKFELVLNMKAAKALGLSVSNAMQLLADEVIE